MSFGVPGLRGLANIEVRTREEYVNREYVNWWLLLAIALSFVNSRLALWALALNFAGPLLKRWSRRAEASD
jgi:hypothetical protein